MLHLMKIEWRKVRIPVFLTIALLSTVTCILTCTLYKGYALNYDLEAWEIGTEIFGMLYPLFVVIPLCWNLYYERKNHFLNYVIPRVSIGRYLMSKWTLHAVSAFCIIFIPWFLSAVFALYVKAPIEPTSPVITEEATNFSHVFQNVFTTVPLLYALLLSVWKGFLGVLVMTLGFVLSLYVKNIFIILTGPFIYAVLENFALAILRLEQYRLVTAFEPTSIAGNAFSVSSFFVGPAILLLFILGSMVYFTKVKKIPIAEV
ncbi:hypothetical protein HL650_05050 [Blautia pseudococcoides]|nr:hypothetical protein HL650_05050 [Blautia pseudococcoides]